MSRQKKTKNDWLGDWVDKYGRVSTAKPYDPYATQWIEVPAPRGEDYQRILNDLLTNMGYKEKKKRKSRKKTGCRKSKIIK